MDSRPLSTTHHKNVMSQMTNTAQKLALPEVRLQIELLKKHGSHVYLHEIR